ncbi:MAG TPA: FliH/SctL family protein [Lachnospiraceae bacterium]|nr:FliH/SctL family protein [Lachnospiraceae bacterium]
MSRNLIKSNWAMVRGEETRIIDTNEMMIRKLESLKVVLHPEQDECFNDGFSEGLDAKQVATLLGENETDDYSDSNHINSGIIKAEPSQPEVDIEAMINDAKEEIDQMKKDALAEIERLKNDTYVKAKKAGYEDGFNEGNNKVKKMEQEIEIKSHQLDDAYEEKIKELEPIFIDTLTGIYEHIFRVEFKNRRDIILHLLINTISKIEGSRDFIVHVSKDDFPYVSMHKKQVATEAISPSSSIEIVEDVTLNKNECLIETDGGIFDCSVGTQLSELEKELKLLSYTK